MLRLRTSNVSHFGRTSFLSAMLLANAGCTVIKPPGWPSSDQEPMVLHPTRGRMYGFAPTSWDLPDGQTIQIEVDRASFIRGAGLYRADVAFTAVYDGERIRCESEPLGPGIPHTRFGCWSEQDDTHWVRFWLAPEEDCPARDLPVFKSVLTPACWNGELTMDGRQFGLSHGYIEKLGPVGYISWLSSEDETLLAANIVPEVQISLYDSATAQLSDDDRRSLMLLTVALSWWEHAG